VPAAGVGRATMMEDIIGARPSGNADEVERLGLEAAGHPPNRPRPKSSQPIELTREVTLARGALGAEAVTCCTIELPAEGRFNDVPGAGVGSATIMEDIIGPRSLDGLDELERVGVEAAGHPPSRPRPRRLQPIELTREVTLASGAPGADAVT